MSQPVTIDIVLPCYNPAPNWVKEVVCSFNELQNNLSNITLGLIIVNDGSTKGITPLDIELLKKEIPSVVFIAYGINKGKGYALRKGIAYSEAFFCIYSDIDFPYTVESMLNIYRRLDMQQEDIVVGSRGDMYYEGVPKVRIAISKLLRLFNRTFLGMKIYDTQCGLKGFNSVGKSLFLKTSIDRYLFDLEFVYLASNNPNARIIPQDVTLKEGVVFSKMNFKVLRQEGWTFIRLVIRHFFSKR